VSGIAGIIRFDGAPAEGAQIAKVIWAMANRGPDGSHHWVSGSVALGHCMLRTTPESLDEIQPLTNEDKTVVLVMDGRLDNREELKQGLQSAGIHIRSRTDAELVLGAYQLWGSDSPHYLLGDFAFAVWDARRQELFCARDHVGVKPFLYFSNENFLAFASDEEALLQLPDVPREPNEDRIAGWLVPIFSEYGFNASNLKDVVKLPPGNTLAVKYNGKKVINRYWQIEPQEEIRFSSDLDYEDAFRAVFREAVGRRMRALGNPALMLSGGLDSSTIAGAARSNGSQMPHTTLHTYSMICDGSPVTCSLEALNETRNIRATVKGHEHHAHLIAVPSLEGTISIDDLKEAVFKDAHPVTNSILLAAMMYLAASRSGHRIMLDGSAGDLTTSTPVRYTSSLLRSGACRAFWAESRQALVNNTYLRHHSLPSILCKSAWDVFAPPSLKRLKATISSSATLRSRSSLINPDFARRIGLAEKLRAWQADNRVFHSLSEQERHIRALFPINIAGSAEGFDLVASRYGIESRHPWSDKSLIEFYVRLPLRYKVHAGWTKYLVRKATAPWLPNAVRWHTGKYHLGGLLWNPLLQASNKEIMISLGRVGGPIDRYLDMNRISRLLDDYWLDPNARGQLGEATTLALWLDRITTARPVRNRMSGTLENKNGS
jgi:asparagine synthase (glutamine-hydrolysing)